MALALSGANPRQWTPSYSTAKTVRKPFTATHGGAAKTRHAAAVARSSLGLSLSGHCGRLGAIPGRYCRGNVCEIMVKPKPSAKRAICPNLATLSLRPNRRTLAESSGRRRCTSFLPACQWPMRLPGTWRTAPMGVQHASRSIYPHSFVWAHGTCARPGCTPGRDYRRPTV